MDKNNKNSTIFIFIFSFICDVTVCFVTLNQAKKGQRSKIVENRKILSRQIIDLKANICFFNLEIASGDFGLTSQRRPKN